MQDFQRYYELLGISPGATTEEVKEAYHRLARQFHPDLNPGDAAAEEKFKAIGEAYEALSEIVEQNQEPTAARAKPERGSAADFCDRGVKKARSGNYRGAIHEYTQAIQVDPSNAQVYCQRGLAFYKLRSYKEAFADYTQALRLDPQLAEAYYHRGTARRKLGYNQGAIQDFDQVIRLAPDDAQAHKKRGMTRLDLGKQRGAIADLQQAAKLFSDQGKIAGFQSTLDLLKKLQQARAKGNRRKLAMGLAMVALLGFIVLLVSSN